MRIAHVTATFPPYLGGAGTTAFELADRLARRGHDVHVFTAAAPGEGPACAATVHRHRPAIAVGNAPVIPALARLRGFDVLHLHYPFIAGAELLSIGRLRDRAPLVVSYHNRLIGDRLRRPIFAAYEETCGRALMRQASAICVVSRTHAQTVDYLRSIARRAPQRLVEVPNGVDLDAFRPGPDEANVRAQLGVGPDRVAVAFVATLDRAHWLKRPDLALEAIARAGDDAGLHLVVVGAGEWLEPLRERARAAGIGDRLSFAGARDHDDLPTVLRACDAMLVPSDRESFGIVLLEAMACGLPVVSTATAGARVVLEGSPAGWLVAIGDADALAAELRALAAMDAPARARMGAAGRARCEERYGWEAVVDRVEAVYARVAGR